MMALKLPRLQSKIPVTQAGGLPAQAFQRWWQRFAEAIELAINSINDILDSLIDILVRLGLVEEAADGALTLSENALELAESAINPDGTIKEDKVVTESMIPDAVTERYFTQNLSDISLTDGVEVDVVSIVMVKIEDESDVDVEPSLRLESADDIRGTIKVYRDALLIDSFDPYMNGVGGTFRICQTLPFTDSGHSAGTYTYKVTFTRAGGASAVTANAGTLVRVREFKR